MKTRSILAFLLLAACSSGPGPSDGGSGSDSGQQQGPCTAMPSQDIGQACCDKYGSNACSTGAFCATPAGGGQGTCAALGTQPDMAPCTANDQCASGGCNTAMGQCQSSTAHPCTTALGCGPSQDPVSPYSYCDPATMVCRTSAGQCKDSCVDSSGCAAGSTFCVGATSSAAGQCCYTNASPCGCKPI